MKEKVNKPNIKEEAHVLRKKAKRIETSRAALKAKNRAKGKALKAYQDRQTELKQNRDEWKAKCKKEEMERIELDKKYKEIASLFEMKEEQLRDILNEFEELKKKYPPKKKHLKAPLQNQ